MDNKQLRTLVIDVVKDNLGSARLAEARNLDENTPLFGREGILDSMGLVNIVLDIEREVRDRTGRAVAPGFPRLA